VDAIERALRAQDDASSLTDDGSDGDDGERPMTPLPDDFFLLPGDAWTPPPWQLAVTHWGGLEEEIEVSDSE
jgi:hypothetical protein